jgi:hypothetical protein
MFVAAYFLEQIAQWHDRDLLRISLAVWGAVVMKVPRLVTVTVTVCHKSFN